MSASAETTRKWIITLDTGRFGDWLIVEAETEEDALATLTKAQRRKLGTIRETKPTRVWREEAGLTDDSQSMPTPTNGSGGRRLRRIAMRQEPQAAVEQAVAVERARKPISPERQLANRITNTRHKMKHPEKSKRDAWTPEEIAAMQTVIDTTVAELAALRSGS